VVPISKLLNKSWFFRRSIAVALLLAACSSAEKKKLPELSSLEGKKVALISIEGEETSRKIVEVALINQLLENGTFILISKQNVEAARADFRQDPTDWEGIAKRAGADYALRAQVLQFDAPLHEGYSTEEAQDSQLAEEQGTDGKTQRVYKVKALDGHVRIELNFTRLSDGETRTGVAEAEDRIEANARTTSIHLPPPLRFLEKLANRAFKSFFEKYR
jgi:hypothetical protein